MLMLLKFLEFRQVLGQFLIGNPLPIATVISHRKRNEMVSHNPYDIQVVVQMFQGFIVKKFMGRVSHGLSSIKPLTPDEWVETSTPPSGDAHHAGFQLDTIIKPQFTKNVKCFFKNAMV